MPETMKTTMLSAHSCTAGVTFLLGIQVILLVSSDQLTDKKSPTELVCYQNFTMKDNFCICSWKAGELSQNVTYTLHYTSHDEEDFDSFPVGNKTLYIIEKDRIHFKEPIYVWVEAREGKQIYKSANISVLLDNTVKLDPPDWKNITVEKYGGSVNVYWTRIDRFSKSMKTRNEVRYKVREDQYEMDQCGSNKTNCAELSWKDTIIPMCKESCTLHFDGDKGHYIQIRQKYENSVWSEWSHPVFIPADINYNLEANYSIENVGNTGMRSLRLKWKPGTKQQGDKTYDISLTLVPCPDVKLHHRTKDSLLNVTISGASYNVTIVISNQAEKSHPWSLSIKETLTGIHFLDLLPSGKNITIKLNETTQNHESYCTEWESAVEKHVLRNHTGNYIVINKDSFHPMQCYSIRVHGITDQHHTTVGEAYYFQSSPDMGPKNLRIGNVTSNSVLLEWDAFDLQKCQHLLRNWEIIIIDHSMNITRRENSSVNWHLVEDLPLGFNCTFEVKGVTIFGENTGCSTRLVFSPWTDTKAENKWPAPVIIPVFALLALGIFLFRTRLRASWLPVSPDPSQSTATTFSEMNNKYILRPINLTDSNCENKEVDHLQIETNVQSNDSKTVKEAETKQMDSTNDILENGIHAMAEAEAETEFHAEYRMQWVATTPGSEKSALLPESSKLKEIDSVSETSLTSV